MFASLFLLILLTSVKSFPTIPNFNELLGKTHNNFLDFMEHTSNDIEEAFSSGYKKAVKLKDTIDNYVEEQKQKISMGVNGYIKKVTDQGRKISDSLSYVPTEDTTVELKNPDTVLGVPARIERNGYKCETHTVISNGYVLNLHRIPHSKTTKEISKNTILLQHGLFGSSADWIINGPDKALPYVLADAGYDVWMSNIRGNKYSREHTKWKINSKLFWNFSWHDVAQHDMPAIIDFIKEFKGNDTKITYIGHSMGTTILFAMLTLRPEYNQVLTAGYALAPVVFMSHFKSPFKALAPVANNVAHMEMLYGSHEFLPKASLLGKMVTACKIDSIDFNVCKKALFQLCGENEEQYNETLLPVFLSGIGAGTSWKTIVHFAQLIVQGDKFQQFDYGSRNNVEMYSTSTPPEYDLSRVTLPVKLFWSRNDLLSSEEDVDELRRRLPPTTENYQVPDPKFSHLDYLWAIDAPTLLNSEILTSLSHSFHEAN